MMPIIQRCHFASVSPPLPPCTTSRCGSVGNVTVPIACMPGRWRSLAQSLLLSSATTLHPQFAVRCSAWISLSLHHSTSGLCMMNDGSHRLRDTVCVCACLRICPWGLQWTRCCFQFSLTSTCVSGLIRSSRLVVRAEHEEKWLIDILDLYHTLVPNVAVM